MTDFDEIRQQLCLLEDEELVSIIRAHDEEKWRPEVFDIVSSILHERGISPGDEPADEAECYDETAGLDLVPLAHYMNYIDAETDRLALEAKGLKVWISDQYAPSMQSIQPGLQLQVLREDMTAAMEILESEPPSSSDLPPEIAEPPCPKCGSREVTEKAEIADSSVNPTNPLNQVWLYHCASCGHKWAEA